MGDRHWDKKNMAAFFQKEVPYLPTGSAWHCGLAPYTPNKAELKYQTQAVNRCDRCDPVQLKI